MELRGHARPLAAGSTATLHAEPAPSTLARSTPTRSTPARNSTVRRFPGGGRVDCFQREAEGDGSANAGSDVRELVDVLLDPARGFADCLSGLYGIDLARGFRRIAAFHSLGPLAASELAGSPFRQSMVGLLAAAGLEGEVFLALWPGAGAPDGDHSGPTLDEMSMCHLLGSSGFAQLCDPVLQRPVPLFLQPWVSGQGLLRPRLRNTESFSSALAVVRVDSQRMILLDKRFCTAG